MIRIMFLSLVGLLLLGGARRAIAEPVHMVCKGKNYFPTGPVAAQTLEDTISVTIDITRGSDGLIVGTAQVDTYKATVFQTNKNDNHVVFVGDPHIKSGLRTGNLDRVTGELFLDLGMFGGLKKGFLGTCRPGQKLF